MKNNYYIRPPKKKILSQKTKKERDAPIVYYPLNGVLYTLVILLAFIGIMAIYFPETRQFLLEQLQNLWNDVTQNFWDM